MTGSAFGLTGRELEILGLIADGRVDKEIAQQLGISVFTINKHVRAILQKMGVESRTHAAIKAIRTGVID